MAYETVLNMCTETIGPEGRSYFPFVFTLFFFILFGNLLGVFPYFFTFTSHIAVTLALTVFVVGLVTFVAIWIHGWHFFSYFVPQGVPVVLLPLLVPIEILSYVSRLISLSVRLFANMMAGHVMLDVFGACWSPACWHRLAAGLFLLAVNVALIGFELLVATLQAYVFAVLTCIYLHDAGNPPINQREYRTWISLPQRPSARASPSSRSRASASASATSSPPWSPAWRATRRHVSVCSASPFSGSR